jgi:ATP-dependent DNA ligase
MSTDLSAFHRIGRPIGPPMLCSTLDVVPDDNRMYASMKLDGWRAFAAAIPTGTVLRSREGHTITQVPYLNDLIAHLVPPGTVLDGELVDRARPRQLRRTRTILQDAGQHVPSTEDPPITFAVFDLLFLGEQDLRHRPLRERLAALKELLRRGLTHWTLPAGGADMEVSPVVMVPHQPSTAAFAQECLDAGEEGVVIKLGDSPYVHGSRRFWWRYKPQDTLDACCTGVTHPRGRSTGQVSSLAFVLDGGASGQVASGLSEAELAHIAAHPDGYVGKVIVLAHHGVEESGALRHPVYLGMRHPADKAAPDPAPPRRQRALDERTIARAASDAPGKRRNYAQMKDPKLLESIESLRAKRGDAYERCLERGSQDPDGDLAYALKEAHRRGLDV